MNNADKHIAHWSNTDVQKYLNGELSAREMHDLEQQALDDPFLADALEGLQTQPGGILQQDLSDLRTRLDTRVTAKPATIPWRAIRVAAAVILLVGLGFTAFYTLLDHKHPSTVATAKAPAPSVAANQLTAPPPATNSAPATASPAQPAASSAPLTYKTDSARSTASGTINARPVLRPTHKTRNLQPAEDLEVSDSLAPVVSQLSTPPPANDILKDTSHSVAVGYINEPKAAPALQSVTIRKFRPALNSDSLKYEEDFAAKPVTFGSNAHLVAVTGRVLDFNNRPVAGASLLYKSKGTITGAVTDAKGQFNLYISQKDTTRQLTVAMPGYYQTQYAFNPEEQSGNTIYLRQTQPELREVVVDGIGAKRKEFMTEPPSDSPEKLDSFWLNTAPAMGRIAYLDYLASARRTIPVDTTIHGTESISFSVDRKGALTEFRIERSLSPAHDAGVIRLISEGPPWKMLHGRSARALVNVTF